MADISSADFESMTDEELAAPAPCPEGVPQELWDLTMAQNADYVDSWKESVHEHVAAYDRQHPEPAEV